MKNYFSKITKTVFFLTLFFSIAGAITGYIFPSFEGENKENALGLLRSRFTTIKERFESGDYRQLLDVVEKMGSVEELKKETDKFAVENFVESGWKVAMAELSGQKEFEIFISQKSGDTNLANEESGENERNRVIFPDIKLLGVTLAAEGQKVVTVFSVNGTTEIWLWEKGEKGWFTDSVTPGYGVKDVRLNKEKIEFSLFSVSNLNAVCPFSFESGAEIPLNQFTAP